MIVAGTRPEIIKLAPLIKRLKSDEYSFVHTGQHHDRNLSAQFIADLGLPHPNMEFRLTCKEPSLQMSEMIAHVHKAIGDFRPEMMCVEGDTNTVLAASIAALKNGTSICHIEAGLRSRDWRMPEEHNRIVADHTSDILFAPTREAGRNLRYENVHGQVHVTGNTVIDAINQNVSIAEAKSSVKIPRHEYILATLHRAENVDDPKTLSSLIRSIISVPIKVVFPIHPRTMSNLRKFGVYEELEQAGNVQIMPPLGYFDFLWLMKKCEFLITDSGGIQEEVTAPSMRKQVLVLRRTTERPEAVKSGFAKVVGTDSKRIVHVVESMLKHSKRLHNSLPNRSPYGDGHASVKIERIIRRYLNKKNHNH